MGRIKKKSSNSTDKRNYIQLLPYRLKLGKYETTGNDVSHHPLGTVKTFYITFCINVTIHFYTYRSYYSHLLCNC